MSGAALITQDVHTAHTHVPSHVWGDDVALTELCSVLFASLPRSDQRRRGVDYLRGLLGVPGRKSIRNIAALLGGSATEQSLHHFVCSSTWDWGQVRQALARHLTSISPPHAWVVRPMVIPKAGENSVGVDRRFFPEIGQVLNAQQAIGVWAAAEEMSSPVNWRIHLSSSWLNNRLRRRQAAIPEHLTAETFGDNATEASLETAAGWGLPLRPVVLDAWDMNVATTIRRFRAAGVPFLARVNSALRLTVTDPALLGRAPEAQPAGQVMTAVRDRLRPVMWRDHDEKRSVRSSLATTVRVQLPYPVRREAGVGDLALLGIGEDRRRWPAELWLTDMTEAQAASLVRLTKLTRRVDRDFHEVADRLGIRDFTGRSYGGWHRHTTLASAAHAVSILRSSQGR